MMPKDLTVLSDEMLKGKGGNRALIALIIVPHWLGSQNSEEQGKEDFEWRSALCLSMNHPPASAKALFVLVFLMQLNFMQE